MESSSEKKQPLPINVQWTQSHSSSVAPSNPISKTDSNPIEIELQSQTDPGPITWTNHNLYFLLNALHQDMSLSTLESFSQEWFPNHSLMVVHSSLMDVLQHKLENSSPSVQHGFAWLAAGIAVLNLPLSSNQHLLLYILSYTVILWGGLKMIHGRMSKRRTQRLLHGLNQMSSHVVQSPEKLDTRFFT
jgi:hypothetical protein